AETDEPLACRRTARRDRFDRSVDRSEQDVLVRAELTPDERASIKSCAVPILRIGDAVVAPIALEAWVADFLLTRFHAAKECLECQIDTHMDILEYLGVNLFQGTPRGFPSRKHLDRIVQTKRFLTIFPRLFA